MSDSEIARLYELCDILQSASPVGDEERVQGGDDKGREKLLNERNISPETPHPATHAAGYLFAHYTREQVAADHNFEEFISAMAANSAATMTGKEFPVYLKKRHPTPPSWQSSPLFQCMRTLATKAEVMSEFKRAFGSDGTQEDQDKFFETYLPTSYYGEQDAVRALMTTGKPDKLLESMNLLVTSFEAKWRFCC